MSEGRTLPLSPSQVKLIRARLAEQDDVREMAMFSLAVDGELHAGDLVSLNVSDVMEKGKLIKRPMILQGRTQKRVTFRMCAYTRSAVTRWIKAAEKDEHDVLFTSTRSGRQLSVGGYGRTVREWMILGGLDPASYGPQSLRQTKASQVVSKRANVKMARDVLGHGRKKPSVRDVGGDE